MEFDKTFGGKGVHFSKYKLWIGFTLVLALAMLWHARPHVKGNQPPEPKAGGLADVAPPETPQKAVTRLTVDGGETFGELLHQAGADSGTTQEILHAARPIMNFRHLRQGQEFVLTRSSEAEIESLCYRPQPGEEICIRRQADGFQAQKESVPVTTQIVTISGTIESSLFDAVIAAKERPELAVRLAEIFAWDLDFYTDPRPGDRFRLVFEKKQYEGGEAVDYGQILAAQYDNDGRTYRAILFHDRGGRPAYYAADGQSLQKAFLRSPLKFAARISSHYNVHRFHPVLKRYRPHLGTDYAAPVGTPVQAVASGRVVFAGRRRGDGNMVQVQHANGYQTYYLHLSRTLVRRGQTLQQGQLVGLVGATGLATGPHLDFRVRRLGNFVDFEKMKLPPARPVARADLKEFEAVRDKWVAELSQPGPALAQSQASETNPAGTP
jgi:murein DD-endopeptidase MepM/ murein hydrolase activator NlpD